MKFDFKRELKQAFSGMTAKSVILDIMFFVAGSTIYALSVDIFTAPNNIAAGGVTGISTMVNYLTGFPIGISNLILNVPLIIWGIIILGSQFFAKTIVATVAMSISIDVLQPLVPTYQGETMLAAIFGGLLSGLGLTLVFMRGGTTGGTDIVARIVNKRFPHFSLGKVILAFDFLVVAMTLIVYGQLEMPLFAIISLFVSSKTIDTIIYGTNVGTGKMMFIMSSKSKEISEQIMSKMRRGVTKLKSEGGYRKTEGDVLLCAVRPQELYKIYDIVRGIDPNAFIITGSSAEITGEGFKEIKSP